MTMLVQMMLVLLLGASHVQGQAPGAGILSGLTVGTCPLYQTSDAFDQQYIDDLTNKTEGFILLFATNMQNRCHRLIFNDNKRFTYSFIDIANYDQTHVSNYTAKPRTSIQPAELNLNLLSNLLGANLYTGVMHSRPLVVDGDKLVLASCFQPFWGVKREEYFVFVPHPNTKAPAEIKFSLAGLLPSEAVLREIDINCSHTSSRAPYPLALAAYNFILSFNQPLELPTQTRLLVQQRSICPHWFPNCQVQAEDISMGSKPVPTYSVMPRVSRSVSTFQPMYDTHPLEYYML